MPDARFGERLMSLLPDRMGRDVFQPARQDLLISYLRRRARARSPLVRRALAISFALSLLALYADCWRLALGESLRRRQSRDRIQSPKPKERFSMFLYLLRHAFRQLVREPAYTVAALLTLALGVGANAAVFAVVEAVLLRPLPYPAAEELVILNHRDQRTGITKEFIAIGDYVDLAARQTTFETLSAYGGGQMSISGVGDPFAVSVLNAGSGLLDILGVRPVLGRGLEPDDSRPGAPPVMLLGHDAWQTRFGGDPSIIGRSVRIGQGERQIVGVTPRGVAFPPTDVADVIIPITVPLEAPAVRKSGWVFAVGRLKPGSTLPDASANLTTISKQLEREYPQSNQASEYFAMPLRHALVGNTRPALVLLFAAVGVVLLIACANVANLLLARSLARRREMALRMALGAGHGRLAAQLLTESLALSLVAGAAGILFAHWGARALVTLLPHSDNVPGLNGVRINGAVLGFTLLIVVVTALVFGLVAALSVRSENAAASLGSPTRATMSLRARRATSALVVVEVALAVVLLVGAGLILRSFAGLMQVDPGFRTKGVMTMGIQLPFDRYREVVSREAFYRSAFAQLRGVRDVEDIGAAVVVPLTGNNWTGSFERPEQPVSAGERPPEVGWQAASGGYFKTLEIPVLAGRLFDERDRPGGPPVVIISEAVQRRFFPNESAVGRQVKIGNNQTAEIVGVVGNVRRAGLRDEPRADMYFPLELNPPGQITLFIRTSSEPDRALPSLQAALRGIEPHLTFLDTRSLADVASESERVTKLVFVLLGVFAGTALALAAVGIYGVMSYAVRQRTREIGTRIALGATRRNILWLVLQQGAVIAVVGTVVGLATGLGTTRFLRSIMFGVSGTDPVTLSVAVAVLVTTIMVACYLPARRAASVDPAKTLAEQ